MDNQVQEELEYILPDDYEEETEETTEEEVVESEVAEDGEATEEVKEVAESLDDLEVKYLHEVKKLKDIPKDELKTLVQKGMNHDRIAEKHADLNSKYEPIKNLANLYGMNEQDFTKALFNQYYNMVAERDGLTPEQVARNVEQESSKTTERMFNKFANKYPDVKAQDIPQEVYDMVNDGEADLLGAYEKYLSKETMLSKDSELKKLNDKILALENKLKTKEQNEAVKKKAVIKSTSVNGVDDLEDDDFLQGLLGK